MSTFTGDGSVLFVEGLKMRPTAFRVLQALHDLGALPGMTQAGCSGQALASSSGVPLHGVRARLQDLRRLGLVESGMFPVVAPCGSQRHYGHCLTCEGVRRVNQG